MMEGENVKAFADTFNNHNPRHRVHPDLSSGLVMPKLSFNEFIRHQIQALDFWSFWAKPKGRGRRR